MLALRSRVVPLGLLLLPLAACSSTEEGQREEQGEGAPDSPAAAAFERAPSGAERLTLELDTFVLPPGGEVYKCQTFRNPLGRDVAILQGQSIMSRGSHHLAVFRFDEESVDRPIEDCSGLEFHSTLHAAQTPVARTVLPDGIGIFLPAEAGIRLNAHYFNLSGESLEAGVDIALDYVDADAVTYKAAQIYLNDGTIDLPPGRGTAGGTLSLPETVGEIKILSVQSHMHRRAVKFESTLVGTDAPFYETDAWDEPPVKVFDPPLVVQAGASIKWRCEFENETAGRLTFGESADTNEMCTLTGFYYPAPEGQLLVGDLAFGRVGLMR